MAKPIVALVGRPNVGKSTLFNRLIGQRYAVVHEAPGTTRDRLYGTADWGGREFTVIDTGGIGVGGDAAFLAEIVEQARFAIEEADLVVLVVDASAGLSPADEEVADLLRRSRKPVLVAANKVDNPRLLPEVAQFYQLGLGEPIPVSAIHGAGTGELLDAIIAQLPERHEAEPEDIDLALAIVGRPNVGKSSLLNALLGQPRAIVSEIPGTTRDALDTLVERDGRRFLLIDTAGIRRRGRVERGVEQWSVLRAERAIDRCDVAVLVLDATQGITAQDTHVAGYVQEAAKGLILAVNKWDLVAKHPKVADEFTALIRRELQFVDWAPIVYLSALTGQRVSRVWELAEEIQAQRSKRIPTSQLNQVIHEAVSAHPLSDRGKLLKVYYAVQVGQRPPTFALFVNDTELVHFSYRRYLENRLRAAFGFGGTAIRLSFRGHERES
jgi:GTP-binding protein